MTSLKSKTENSGSTQSHQPLVLSEIQTFMEKLGLWPEQEPYGARVILNSLVSFGLFIGPQLIFIAKSDQFLHSCESLCEMIGVSMFNIQLHTNAFNNQKLRRLVKNLREFWKRASSLERPAWRQYDEEFRGKVCFATKFVTYSFMLQGISYVLGTELSLLLLKRLGFAVNTFSYGMHVNYFYDAFHSNWRFFIPMFCTVSLYMPIFVVSYLLTGFFGAQLIVTLTGCFDFIRMELEYLKEEARKETCAVEEALKEIVKYHVEAMSMAKELDECLKFIFMVKFSFNILFMCLMMFIFLIDFDLVVFTKICVFFLMVFSENSAFFFISDRLMEKAEDIAEVTYDFDWFDQSEPAKLTVLMMIAQAQRTVALTAGGFYDVTIRKYSEHLQVAFNYYNVLREMVSS